MIVKMTAILIVIKRKIAIKKIIQQRIVAIKKELFLMSRYEYAKIGVDTEKAINILRDIPVSLLCWQGDDISFFEDIKEYEKNELSTR